MSPAAPPTPKLANREALDELLASQAAKGVLPAIFMAVTNAEGDLYINQTGDRVFGQPDKGPVTEDTRAYCLTCATDRD